MFGYYLRRCFSQGSSRSRLGDFYKNIHPDILHNASEKIKEENLRSLKILNSYFDSLAQNKGVTEQILTFHAPEKDNKKAKKFFEFKVNLEPLRSEAPPQVVQDHIAKTVQSLLQSVGRVKDMNKRKYQFSPSENDKVSFQNDFQYTMKPLSKYGLDVLSNIEDDQSSKFKILNTLNAINQKSLESKISKEIMRFDRMGSKSAIWSKILTEGNQAMNDLSSLYSRFIDPRLIYIDNSLEKREIKKCKRNFK